MDLQTIRDKQFTEENLEEIRKTRGYKFTNVPSRLNVNVSLVYEKTGDTPFVIESRKCSPVRNSEDAVKRSIEVKKGETVSLDCMWLESKVGSVFIKNTTGLNLPSHPKEEIKKQIADSEAVVKIGNSEIPLLPNQVMLFPGPRVGKVSVTATRFDVMIQYCIFPS